jgi:hypothetical protein
LGFCRHEKYVTQYRAVFVKNCKIGSDQVSQHNNPEPRRAKRGRKSGESEAGSAGGETLHKVSCSVCSTEVGIIDGDEVYHFFNVLPSESWHANFHYKFPVCSEFHFNTGLLHRYQHFKGNAL